MLKKIKNKKTIFIVILSLLFVLGVGMTLSGAWFSDTEASSQNLEAATLDLSVNGSNGQYITTLDKENFRPGNQPKVLIHLRNEGSLPGYLDINAAVANAENGCGEPEVEAGDITCGETEGELGSIIGLSINLDLDCNGWVGVGDRSLFDGHPDDIGNMNSNILIPAGGEVCLNITYNWWSTANDNLAQSDSLTVEYLFLLDQQQ